jgi:hypothetical protein
MFYYNINQVVMKTYIIIALLFIACQVHSQFYFKEAGFRGGVTPGVTLRINLDEELSYEALLSFRNYGAQLHLIRQENRELAFNKAGTFNLYYGFGVHAGFYFTDHYSIFFKTIYFGQRIFSPLIGVDGYAALEYRLFDSPFSFGVDYKPYMEASLRQLFSVNIWDFSLNVKYRF